MLDSSGPLAIFLEIEMQTLPKFITFTGADANTDIDGMVDLGNLYPIEWGILYSPKRQGQGRYPHFDWVRKLCQRSHELRLSAHLCGGHSVAVIEFGRCGLEEPLAAHFARVQVNTAAHVSPASIEVWAANIGIHPILQCRGAFPDNGDVSWLFDASGGRGISPSAWPAHGNPHFMRGYAGGLGPDNVVAAVAQIGALSGNYWIDMETRVRDDADNFDLDKVRAVCEAVYGATTPT